MLYCEYCEEWSDSDDGRCDVCQKLIKNKNKEEEINEDLDEIEQEELDWY